MRGRRPQTPSVGYAIAKARWNALSPEEKRTTPHPVDPNAPAFGRVPGVPTKRALVRTCEPRKLAQR